MPEDGHMAERVRSAFALIVPLGEMLEKTHEVLLAHHVGGAEGAKLCPICLAFQDEVTEILDRWSDARARALEHWDV